MTEILYELAIVLLAMLIGADLVTTMLGLHVGLKEMNPVAREFGLTWLFVLQWGLVWLLIAYRTVMESAWAVGAVVLLLVTRAYVVRHNWRRVLRRIDGR
ncbi:MAG: hypothetical protein D6775_08160 [Caldilineae bacterium]|nr:MAG: hypothetical protein D6775_08160 [Caldilineae bacterium]